MLVTSVARPAEITLVEQVEQADDHLGGRLIADAVTRDRCEDLLPPVIERRVLARVAPHPMGDHVHSGGDGEGLSGLSVGVHENHEAARFRGRDERPRLLHGRLDEADVIDRLQANRAVGRDPGGDRF
jgi:hypothetical protein